MHVEPCASQQARHASGHGNLGSPRYFDPQPQQALAGVRRAVPARAGAARSVTCRALGEGASLVQVSRELFMAFVAAKPRTLQIYLHKVLPGMRCAFMPPRESGAVTLLLSMQPVSSSPQWPEPPWGCVAPS